MEPSYDGFQTGSIYKANKEYAGRRFFVPICQGFSVETAPRLTSFYSQTAEQML